jgi:hypothetical protein
VGLDVDEARRHREPRHVDLVLGGTGDVANCCDPASANGQIATYPWQAIAVIQRAASQQEVETHAANSISLGTNAGGADDLMPTLAFSIDIGLRLNCGTADGYIAEP